MRYSLDMYINYLRIFLLGSGVLGAAILFNLIARKIGVNTWYDFVNKPGDADMASILWLFLVYPFLLGLSAYLLSKLLWKKKG